MAGFRPSRAGDRCGMLLTLQIFVAHEDAVACPLRHTHSPLHLLAISVKLRSGFLVDPVTEGFLPPSVRPPRPLLSPHTPRKPEGLRVPADASGLCPAARGARLLPGRLSGRDPSLCVCWF